MTDQGNDDERDDWLVNLAPLGLICGGDGTALEPTWIDLTAPDQVFYGLNGAGKTTVLDSLRGALTGRQARGSLLVRLPYTDARVSNGLSDAIQKMLLGDDFGLDLDSAQAEFVRRKAEAAKSEFAGRRRVSGWALQEENAEGLDWDALIEELAASAYWLFSPIGADHGKWTASPVVLVDSSASKWSEHLSALRNMDANEDSYVLLSDLGLGLLWSEWAGGPPVEAPVGICGLLFSSMTDERAWYPDWPFGQIVSDDDIEAAARTRHHLITHPADRWGTRTSEFARDEDLSMRAAAIEKRANMVIGELLADAPALRLKLGSDEEWFSGRSCSWSATRCEGETPMSLGELSWAEKRWADIAVQIALAEEAEYGTTWLLLDEPERGLHRTAESHMARAIRDRASVGQKSALATHSPELLDAGAAEVNYVRRRSHDRAGAVVPMGEFDDVRSALGLNPSDMLRRTRGIALVEGEHDFEVLSGSIGPELDKLGVEILATRGGSSLKTVVDSRFLYDFTDAILFPILDDLNAGSVSELWKQAVADARTMPASEVVESLVSGIKKLEGKGDDYLGGFLTASVKHGSFERVHPLGIPETDVLACLPVEALVPDATSWRALREAGRRGNGGVELSETKFKQYLEKVHRANLSLERIRQIAENSPTHPSIKSILAEIADRLSN